MSDWTFGAGATWPTRAEEDALTARQRDRAGSHIEARRDGYKVWSRDEIKIFLTSAIYAALQVLVYQRETPTTMAYRAGVEAVAEAFYPLVGLHYEKSS